MKVRMGTGSSESSVGVAFRGCEMLRPFLTRGRDEDKVSADVMETAGRCRDGDVRRCNNSQDEAKVTEEFPLCYR